MAARDILSRQAHAGTGVTAPRKGPGLVIFPFGPWTWREGQPVKIEHGETPAVSTS